MTRPGPRPYECVRRAWHSDRHQPMRGSLIQEMFRIANEVHSPATRKNKEWQQKLPVVVLKAEEIIYSKANSEAEYMDFKTLWERANDAIDTIIRRDDTPETGDLLQPCIEAALNLGCIPRRASRSQRHNNPGFYLSSATREAQAAEAADSNKGHLLGSSAQLLPLPQHPNNLSSPSSQPAPRYSAHTSGCPSKAACVALQISCPNVGRAYPLYYNDNQPKMSFRPALQSPQDPFSNSFINAVPTGLLWNFFDINASKDASDRSLTFVEASGDPSSDACDLALRLSLPSPPSIGVETAWTREVEDVGSSSSSDGSGRATNLRSSSSFSKDKVFDLFRLDATDEAFESCSSKGSSGTEEGALYVEIPGTKRREPVGGSFGNGCICWKRRITTTPLLCRTETPDSHTL